MTSKRHGLTLAGTLCVSCIACAHAPPSQSSWPIEPSALAPSSGAIPPPLEPRMTPEPSPPPPLVISFTPKSRSSALASGFFNPMPGGVLAGYRADTGLDIAGSPRPVYAIASGTLDYSEAGHTLWTGPKDTPNCIRFELDAPIPYRGRKITHVYYAHLSKLEIDLHDGARPRVHVNGGDMLGVSGVANHSPHLHVGFLLDGEVEQTWGTFLLEDDIRKVIGDLRNGYRLPGGRDTAPATKMTWKNLET